MRWTAGQDFRVGSLGMELGGWKWEIPITNCFDLFFEAVLSAHAETQPPTCRRRLQLIEVIADVVHAPLVGSEAADMHLGLHAMRVVHVVMLSAHAETL